MGPLLLVVLLTGWAWAPILTLPFTGEDYVILGRIAVGEPGSLHVFRPIADGWLSVLHGLAAVDSPLPYHAASLLLHLLNTTLVYLIALELFGQRSGSPWSAAVVAGLFGLGAGSMDALAWTAAVNRPLAGLFTLTAFLGLLRLEKDRVAPVLVLAGGVLLLFTNHEAYGVLPLLVLWLAQRAVVRRDLRIQTGLMAAILSLVTVAYYFTFERVQDSQESVLHTNLMGVLQSILVRTEQVASGLGLPGPAGIVLPVAGAVVIGLNGNRRALWLGIGAWIASFFPFVLGDSWNYRAYPSLAPNALLVGGALVVVGGHLLRARGASSARLWAPFTILFLVAVFFGSRAERNWRLTRWWEGTRELEICARDARRLAAEAPDDVPMLVNLELSSCGPFQYFFNVTHAEDLRWFGFLDAASAYEEPGQRQDDVPKRPWYGRRFDGTYGFFDAPAYFAERPEVEALKLYDQWELVAGMEEARQALTEKEIDLTRVALVEGPGVPDPPLEGLSVSTIEIVTSLETEHFSASLQVRVVNDVPALFVYQEHWLFELLYRVSPDQAVITDQGERRQVGLRAVDRATGEIFEAHAVNAFGTGVFLPPGDRTLDLEWSLRPADRIRR